MKKPQHEIVRRTRGRDTDMATGVYVDLGLGRGLGGAAKGDVFVDVEAVYGSYNLGDVLIGSNGDNVLYGNGGQDVLRGEVANDAVFEMRRLA